MTTVVRGGTLIDGTGDDPRPADVTLADGLIRSVDAASTPSSRDEVIDVDGLTLLPGLIDAHTHFGLVDLTPPFAPHSHGVSVPGLVQQALVCDGPEEVRIAARTVFRHGATQVKVCVSGGVVSLTDRLEDTQFSVDELRAAVEEAEARETYVTAHAHNVRGIRNGLEAGVRCFEHGTFLDEATATALAEAGAWLVPTLAVTRVLTEEWETWGLPKEVVPRMSGVEEAMTQSVKLAYDAGVLIGSGSDLIGPAQNRRGLELTLKARILGPMAAIVSATSTNARIVGASDRLGSVEVGKVADLIAIDGDPLTDPDVFDDPARVVLVVKDGRVVKDSRGAAG